LTVDDVQEKAQYHYKLFAEVEKRT
jgi:hypothetical protein